jgi:T5SS/PEP-CTERM-associated repeat protein
MATAAFASTPDVATNPVRPDTDGTLRSRTPLDASNTASQSDTSSRTQAGGRKAGSDVAVNWTNGGGDGLWSNAANWAGGIVPSTATDDPTFGAAPAGNYTVTNNLVPSLGILNINRALATETTTLNGGYKGTQMIVANGRLVVDGGTSTVGTAASTAIAIQVATTATSNASLTFQNGAVVTYSDALAGFNNTATSALTVTGPGTKLQRVSSTFDSFFGANAGTSTVTISNGAEVEAYLNRTGLNTTYNITTGGKLILNPRAANDAGTANFGNLNGGTVNWAVNGVGSEIIANNGPAASLDNPDDYGWVWLGSGNGSNTTGTISNGGKVTAGFVAITAGSYSTAGTTPVVVGSNTLTVDGAGSQFSADVFGIGGLTLYSNGSGGTTTVNITNGGLIDSPIIALGAAPKAALVAGQPTPVPVSIVTVSGAGSTLLGATALNAYDGEIILGLRDGTSSTLNVTGGGLVQAGLFSDNGVGSTATLNVNTGGVVDVISTELGTGTGTGGMNTTINVTNGGSFDTIDMLTATGLGGKLTVNVSGNQSLFKVDEIIRTGGLNTGTSGVGATIFNVSNGGLANFGAIFAGRPDAVSPGQDPLATTFTVTGAGSSIVVDGYTDGVDPLNDVSAIVIMGSGINTTATINVEDGALFDVLSTVGTPDLSGGIFMATNEGTTAVINVDGAGSILNGGTLITMSQVDDPQLPFGFASSTINVKNGGALNVAGNLQMAVAAGDSLQATLNVGLASGGTAADADTAVTVDGVLFVGGSGPVDAPIPGSPSTVTLNNGDIFAGAALIYQGSTVNISRGSLTAFDIAARGGNIVIANSAGTNALLDADSFEASNGGFIDIGKSGGIAETLAVTDTDLADVKALILAGRNGGTWDGVNGIRSSFVAANPLTYGIGYADITLAGITSFFGVTFAPGDEAVVFRTTRFGDANVDGTVNFNDLLALAQNYNGTSKEWFQGDFDYNGLVNFNDLLALAQNYNQSALIDVSAFGADFASDWALAVALTPEPASLTVLMGLGALGIRRRR